MEIGKAAKPPHQQATARAEPAASAGTAAATPDLPPEAAVPQPEAVRFEPSEGSERRAALDEAVRAAMERHLTIDPKTRAVVVQSVDPHTGQVIQQVPDETLLKLRVYARELRDAGASEAGDGARRPGRLA